MRTADGLREAIREHRFVWDERSFSLGRQHRRGAHQCGVRGCRCLLLSAADSACQAAKEAGRNRVYSYQENDIDLMRRRREMQWAARISNALEENRFELFRQTIQPLQVRDEGAHYELLLRMRDENGKLVSPGPVHIGRRALWHHAQYRPLGREPGLPLAGVGGRRAGTPVALFHQPVGPEPDG